MRPEVQRGEFPGLRLYILGRHAPAFPDGAGLRINPIVIRSDYAFLTLAPASAERHSPTTKPTSSGRKTGSPQTSKSLRPNFICSHGNTGVVLAL